MVLALIFLILLVGDTEVMACCSQGHWSAVTIKDITVPGSVGSLPATSLIRCAANCLKQTGCRTFAFRKQTSTCLFYDHLVEYTTSGTVTPGMRYYWLLSPRCPTDLGYTLEDNVCYKLYTDWKKWNFAHDRCAGERGIFFMATTSAKEALARRVSQTQPGMYIWLGGTDRVVEGEWRWLSGAPITSGWQNEQPDNYNDADIMYIGPSALYDDTSATEDMQTLCEIPMAPSY